MHLPPIRSDIFPADMARVCPIGTVSHSRGFDTMTAQRGAPDGSNKDGWRIVFSWSTFFQRLVSDSAPAENVLRVSIINWEVPDWYTLQLAWLCNTLMGKLVEEAPFSKWSSHVRPLCSFTSCNGDYGLKKRSWMLWIVFIGHNVSGY